MDPTPRRRWIPAVVLVGAVYAAVGIAFALPATHARFWRLSAWAVSGVVYALHIGYERIGMRHSTLSSALHVAWAAALGSFGLAVGANVHALSLDSSSRQQTLLLVALVAWPLITAPPAFLVGLGASALLARWTRRAPVESGREHG